MLYHNLILNISEKLNHKNILNFIFINKLTLSTLYYKYKNFNKIYEKININNVIFLLNYLEIEKKYTFIDLLFKICVKNIINKFDIINFLIKNQYIILSEKTCKFLLKEHKKQKDIYKHFKFEDDEYFIEKYKEELNEINFYFKNLFDKFDRDILRDAQIKSYKYY